MHLQLPVGSIMFQQKITDPKVINYISSLSARIRIRCGGMNLSCHSDAARKLYQRTPESYKYSMYLIEIAHYKYPFSIIFSNIFFHMYLTLFFLLAEVVPERMWSLWSKVCYFADFETKMLKSLIHCPCKLKAFISLWLFKSRHNV